MKKIVALVLIAVTCLSFASCGGNDKIDGNTQPSTSENITAEGVTSAYVEETTTQPPTTTQPQTTADVNTTKAPVTTKPAPTATQVPEITLSATEVSTTKENSAKVADSEVANALLEKHLKGYTYLFEADKISSSYQNTGDVKYKNEFHAQLKLARQEFVELRDLSAQYVNLQDVLYDIDYVIEIIDEKSTSERFYMIDVSHYLDNIKSELYEYIIPNF